MVYWTKTKGGSFMGQRNAGPLLSRLGGLLCGLVCLLSLPGCLRPQTPPPSVPPATTPPPPYEGVTFTYDDRGFLTSDDIACVPGIDVSYYQGAIDWPAVKAAGVEFAMIRLGYRSYRDGLLHTDPRAEENLRGAKAAGLQIGAYFFSQATSASQALEEAHYALEILGETELDLPLAFDWEYVSEDVPSAQITGPALEQCVRRFCDTVEQAGYESMIYFNMDLAKTRLELDDLQEYPFWLAWYADQLNFSHKIRLWQYSDKGRVPGIEGNVDLNLYFPA